MPRGSGIVISTIDIASRLNFGKSKTMASEILGQATEKVKGLAGEKTGKVAQLAAVTKDVHDDKWRITSDYGAKQSNTDDWLTVGNDDQTGPLLLEDHFAREKVCLAA